MKLVVFIVTLLIAIPAIGQVIPSDASTVLAGPVLTDGKLGLVIGYSKKVIGLQLVTFGKFGKTVETEAEVLKLFKLLNKLYVGPVAGGGVDWSDEAGTGGVPTASYIFGATGVAATYEFAEKFGAWVFWKRVIAKKENEPSAGIGLYYNL